ncbi:MAG: hypothetical protein Q9166_008200 [cf. Caloplaca sp. 2 TL-2023]
MAFTKRMQELEAQVEAMKIQLQEKEAQEEAMKTQLQEKEAHEEAMIIQLQEMDQFIQQTNLDELLQACHEFLFQKLEVQSDPVKSTRGTITQPKRGRAYPHLLKEWSDFPDIRDKTFDSIHEALHPAEGSFRAFTSVSTIQGMGKLLDGVLSSEEDLKRFQHTAIEQFVASVITFLAENGTFHTNLGDGIQFHNQSHALDDQQDEVRQRQQISTEQATQSPKYAQKNVPKPTHADQLCVTRKDDTNLLLYIEEYKAAHKLTLDFLQQALRGTLNISKIRNRPTIAGDPDDRFLESAEALVAAAATQTYSYMLEGGLEYSCIITGEAIVFLQIEHSEPGTLYYHLAIPSQEVNVDTGEAPDYSKSAIAQMLTFSLLAFESVPRDQVWRDTALGKADKWQVDYDQFEHELPTPRDKRTRKDKSYKGKKPVSSFTYTTRSKGKDGHDDDNPPSDGNDGDHLPEGSDDDPSKAETPCKPKRSQGNTSRKNQGGQGSSKRYAQQHYPYCTQACLLGMVSKTKVDETCPNAALHPRHKSNTTHHLLGARKFRSLVQEQLGETLDENFTDLHVNGARGMLFKVTLASHGYTFVGKGTIDVFVPDLTHEGEIYHRLRSLQGKNIPVFLGNIDLKTPWYAPRIHIIHLLMMSHGGEMVQGLDRQMQKQISRFEAKLDRLGIKHEDLRRPNMLWNNELQRLIFIDFERSTIQPRVKNVSRMLGEISSNKGSPRTKSPTKSSPSKTLTSSKYTEEHATSAFKVSNDEDKMLELPIPSPELLPSQEGLFREEEIFAAPKLPLFLPPLSDQVTWPNPIR